MTRNVLALGFVGLLASAVAGGEALADPPVRAQARLAWGNQAGWTYLGEARVSGRGGNLLQLDRGERRLDRIMLVGRDRTDLRAVRVHLTGGNSFVARIGDFQGRAVIDLPDRGRVAAIELLGGRYGRRWASAVEVYGDLRERGQGYGNGPGYDRDPGNGYGIGGGGGGYQPAPEPAYQPPYQPAMTWQPLGSVSIDGRRDRETIVVGRDEGRFRQLMLTTSGGVTLHNLTVTFLSGETASLPLRSAASGNGLVVDLPGDARGIREVSFSASSQAGYYGNARVDLAAM